MELNEKDIGELLVILNIALVDISEALRHAQSAAERNALQTQQAMLRQWIARLSKAR